MSHTQTTLPGRNAMKVSWQGLEQGETGDAFLVASFADRSAQVSGVFGGATVVIEGSNNDSTYHTLTDPQGNLISFTTPGLELVMELVSSIRPRVVGGDGTTSLNIDMVVKVV